MVAMAVHCAEQPLSVGRHPCKHSLHCRGLNAHTSNPFRPQKGSYGTGQAVRAHPRDGTGCMRDGACGCHHRTGGLSALLPPTFHSALHPTHADGPLQTSRRQATASGAMLLYPFPRLPGQPVHAQF
jgi:hypothetical protein